MKNYKIFYGSSYDRGLDRLLQMWSRIKNEIPEATLDIAYGWNLFDKAFTNNPERQAWKAKMELLMSQEGITHHGRIGKNELQRVRKQCGIWAYPTYFAEINCITALECQRDGLVPVVINYAALDETVQTGLKIDGDIYEQETFDKYVNDLVGLMKDRAKWEEESKKAVEFAKSYDWPLIAKGWAEFF